MLKINFSHCVVLLFYALKIVNTLKNLFIKRGGKIRSNPENILLIQLGDIGDVILTFPCLRALRETYPAANIQIAVRKKAEGLIREGQEADGVIPISKEKRGFLGIIQHQIYFVKKLRSHNFDLAIDLRTGTRGAIMAFLSGARERISFQAHDEPFWRNRLFTTLLDHPYHPGQHVTDYLLDFLAVFKIIPSSNIPEYVISRKALNEAKAILHREGIKCGQPVIAIQPFSLWSYKELPEKTMAALINKIQQNHQVDIILIGAPTEREMATSLEKSIDKKIHNLVGQTSISILPALLNYCSFFIGIDSAGLHIAAAVGTRTAAIFGPSSPDSWAPKGNSHLVIQADLPCVPCRQKGCNNKETSKCLRMLNYENIYQTIKPVIIDIVNDNK